LKSVDVKFQAEIRYCASTNYLWDYKIYEIGIKMFIPESLSNLPQPPRDDPWLAYLINRNFKTGFHRQCDYLLGCQAFKKISDSIFLKYGEETIQMQRMIHMKH
jgi:hypothetical protein